MQIGFLFSLLTKATRELDTKSVLACKGLYFVLCPFDFYNCVTLLPKHKWLSVVPEFSAVQFKSQTRSNEKRFQRHSIGSSHVAPLGHTNLTYRSGNRFLYVMYLCTQAGGREGHIILVVILGQPLLRACNHSVV